MIKYTIFWTSKAESDKIYQLIVELPHLETVLEGIRDIIPYFNEQLVQNGSNRALSLDPNLFELYKAKKSGRPKIDYPGSESNDSYIL